MIVASDRFHMSPTDRGHVAEASPTAAEILKFPQERRRENGRRKGREGKEREGDSKERKGKETRGRPCNTRYGKNCSAFEK